MAGIKKIRDNLESPFVKVLVAAIVITFALFFGWGTVFSSSDANTVATVNGKKIDLYDLDLEMSRVQSILNQRLEDTKLNIEEEMLKSISINSLIRNTLVLDYLNNNKVNISDLTAYRLLAKNEVFLDEGKFSLQKVDSFSRQNGILPGKYVSSIKNDIALNFWRIGLNGSSFTTRYEVEKNFKLLNQTRDITFLKINSSVFEQDLQISEESILSFYNENPLLFQTERKAKARYIELSLEELKSGVIVGEEEILKEYKEYSENFDSSIRRSVSHLEIKIKEEVKEKEAISLANNLKQRLGLGEKFETLVSEYSDDEGTRNSEGILGISDGTAFPPEFESALLNLNEGEVSSPVLLNGSVHLLKLTDIQNPIPEDFESMKELLEEGLSMELALSKFTDLLEITSDLTFSLNNLDKISEEIQVKVKETNYFTRLQPDDVFKEIALLNMVFEDSNIQGGQLSDLIELKEDKAVVFELVNFQDQKTEGYKTVREKVKIELKNRLLEEKMIFLQSKIFEALNSGESLDTISANEGIKVASYKGIKRDSSLFPKVALSEIFSLPMSSQSTTFSSAPLPGGDRLIFSLNAINEIDQTISDEEITSLKQYFSKERSESEMVDLQINMQNSAAITLKNSSN